MTKIAFSEMALAQKLDAGDPAWKQFNGSFENLDLDRMDIVNQIFTGHSFTTWHANHWRHGDNYILGQHFGLDFDTEDERSTIAHLLKKPLIAKYASIVYTTPNQRPDAPRARVVFELDTAIHQAKNYTLAAKSLVYLFSASDSKCKDAARFFYGSIGCAAEVLDNILPLRKLREWISDYQDIMKHYVAPQTRNARGTTTPTGDTDASLTVTGAIRRAQREGDRNNIGFWLACTLFEKGLTQTQVTEQMTTYQRGVDRSDDPYTMKEATKSIRTAIRR